MADPSIIDLGAVRDARCEGDLIGHLAADFVACYDPAEAVDTLRREHPHATEAQMADALRQAAEISAAVAARAGEEDTGGGRHAGWCRAVADALDAGVLDDPDTRGALWRAWSGGGE
jgi:hypothetical protein